MNRISKQKGRPPRNYAKIKAAVLIALDNVATLKDAYKIVGVAASTMTKIKNTDPQFRDKIEAFKKKKNETPAGDNKEPPKKVILPTITELKERYRKVLAAQGKGDVAIDAQLDIVALRWIEVCRWRAEREKDGYTPIIEEKSREGHLRQKEHVIEKLYTEALKDYQDALRAGGMNFDCKAFEIAAMSFDDDDDYDNWQPSNK